MPNAGGSRAGSVHPTVPPMKVLFRYFVNGALVVTPFAITGYLVWQVVALRT